MSRGKLSLDAPRAATMPPGAPLYESHYLTAVDPEGGRAVWLRYTAHKQRGEMPSGQLWCTWFDARDVAPVVVARRTAIPLSLRTPPGSRWSEIGGAWIGPGHAEGALEEFTWGVAWDTREAGEPLAYLPAPWMYDRRLPRSNGAALVPDARFAGRLAVGGETVDLDGWRGMVGHNWGADHADRWIWLHVPGFGARDPSGWLDMVLVRVRVGPLLTPWLPSGGLYLDRRRRGISAVAAARGLRVAVEDDRLDVQLPRMGAGAVDGGAVGLRVSLPPGRVAHWDYPGPGGSGRLVRNCSVASAVVALPGSPVVRVDDRVAVEIGG